MGDLCEARASLRIFGPDLLPDEISNLLGCLPTKSAKVGDIDLRQKHRTQIVKEGFWLLRLDKEDDFILEKKIEMLLTKLTSDLDIWKQITSRFRIDIYCGLFLTDLNEGFSLSPVLLKKLVERGLKIEFDIYSKD